MVRKPISATAIRRRHRAALLGAALLCAGMAPAAAAPSPEAAARESAEPRTLVLPGEAGFTFGLLGSLEVRTPAHRFKAQWQDLLSRADAEQALYDSCAGGRKCAPELKAWRALVRKLDGLPQKDQMEHANRAVNRLVKYRDDAKAFHARDHWATPAEALRSGGDCEDYAILKFITLLELGFDPEQLRMTIVRNRARNLMHAVLAVKLDGKTYILDNLNSYAVEHHYVLKYVPLYSASLDAQWVHVVTSQIRARFVTHVMREQERADEAPPRRVTKAEAKPAAKRARDGRIVLVGSYAQDWT